ncbi:MAG TPA: 16S rRNA (cytidine(1402)-2'-O)-methyltransferase [Gemmatimonadaceae bacterium]|nr:16S rRNA (cytidine(1402)-2'-O)-methyltransferase [Gemmatimonadaceae bacterium]
MAGSLYVVSTPIGNLDDITVRALHTLKSVGLIAAEDTRRTGLLLRHFGITTPTTSLHAHNETEKVPALVRKLADGVDIALVSDAGTPLVADPGQRLIESATGQGIRVIPIPGASAVLTALAASGLPADEFVFAGFAPPRSNHRKTWLESLAKEPRTVVFFEAPHRITKTLTDMANILGERPIIIARELTKLHEEVVHTTARLAPDLNVNPRGEFTLILGPHTTRSVQPESIDDASISSYFYQLTDDGALSRRTAVVRTAERFGLSPNDVYQRLERLKTTTQP